MLLFCHFYVWDYIGVHYSLTSWENFVKPSAHFKPKINLVFIPVHDIKHILLLIVNEAWYVPVPQCQPGCSYFFHFGDVLPHNLAKFSLSLS